MPDATWKISRCEQLRKKKNPPTPKREKGGEFIFIIKGFCYGSVSKESAYNAGDMQV